MWRALIGCGGCSVNFCTAGRWHSAVSWLWTEYYCALSGTSATGMSTTFPTVFRAFPHHFCLACGPPAGHNACGSHSVRDIAPCDTQHAPQKRLRPARSLACSHRMLTIMGNLCCGGDDPQVNNKLPISRTPPPPKVMTPTDDERRRQALAAAEERARQGAVRGTQRTQCVTYYVLFSKTCFDIDALLYPFYVRHRLLTYHSCGTAHRVVTCDMLDQSPNQRSMRITLPLAKVDQTFRFV